jgi:hypothetical protein
MIKVASIVRSRFLKEGKEEHPETLIDKEGYHPPITIQQTNVNSSPYQTFNSLSQL